MSSDIPKARALLNDLILELNQLELTVDIIKTYVNEIRPLLKRRKPAFRAPATHKALTSQQIARARKLRKQEWGLQDIAETLGVQIGRVSDAVK